MSRRLACEIVRSATELEQLAASWQALWSRSPEATPFQSPAWLIPWWRAFHPGELATVAVRCGPRLVGLAPFYLERGQRLRLLPLGISISDYLDVLAEAELREPVLRAISRAYASMPEVFAEWELPELQPHSVALSIPVPQGFGAAAKASGACPVLELRSPALADVPAPMRRKLRMTRHRIERHGGAQILRTADRNGAWWFSQLSRLHGARWSARGESGLLCDSRLELHHMAAMTALALNGMLRMYALVLGEAVAGVYYGFADRLRAYAYLGGFDRSFAYYSPGTALLGTAIEDGIRDGVHEFHFLRGREAYKYAWGAKDRASTRLVIARTAG